MSREENCELDAIFSDPEKILSLYAQGAFPMGNEDGEVDWYYPEIRAIIPLESFNIPRSLRRFKAKNALDITFNKTPIEVIKNCANRKKTWITEKIFEAYKLLIDINCIGSVEIWKNQELVGGLYGIHFRGAFFGESMFSKTPQASKVALASLLERLRERSYTLLDVQFLTSHLKMFGAIEISIEKYRMLLNEAYSKDCDFL